MDFQSLMAQAAVNTASAGRRLSSHRSEASTRTASVPSIGKLSAVERKAAVQAQLAKASAPSSKSSTRPAASSSTAASHLKPVKVETKSPGPASSESVAGKTLFKAASKREALSASSSSNGHAHETRRKPVGDVKANKTTAPAPKQCTTKPPSAKTALPASRLKASSRESGKKNPASHQTPVPSLAAPRSNTPPPCKLKRPISKGKPVDFSSLLNTAKANTAKVDPAKSRGKLEKPRRSDDDEPVGRALIDGPRIPIAKGELHLKGVRPSTTPSKKQIPTQQVAPLPQYSAKSDVIRPSPKTQQTSRPSFAGALSAASVANVKVEGSANHDRRPGKESSKSKPLKSSVPSSAEKSTVSPGPDRPAPRGLDGGKAGKTPVLVKREGVTPTHHSSPIELQRRPTSDSKPVLAKAKTQQSRMDSFYSSDRREKDASGKHSTAPRPAAAVVSKDVHTAAKTEAGMGKRKKTPWTRRDPIWLGKEGWSDEDDAEAEDVDVSKYIKQIFGYDRSKYVDEDPRDLPMESNWAQVEKEEKRSARLGRMEDLREEKLEAEREARRRKRRCIDDDDDD